MLVCNHHHWAPFSRLSAPDTYRDAVSQSDAVTCATGIRKAGFSEPQVCRYSGALHLQELNDTTCYRYIGAVQQRGIISLLV